jgi:segregation and condensation protein B
MQDDETGEPPLTAHEGDTTTAEGGALDPAPESRAPEGASPDGERAQDAPVLPPDEIRAVLEALIFASPQPLTAREIGKVLIGVPKEAWAAAVDEIRADYARDGRGLQLVDVAAGYQITTRPEYNDWVRELLDPRAPTRLSIQALETLAVIAYKQPVTLPEIIDLRGVKSGGVLKTLLEKRLIRITGRKEVVGRPMLYGTTKEFLLHFGLKDLGELPKIEEFAEVLGEEVDVAGLKKAIDAPRPVEIPLSEGETAATGDDSQGILPLDLPPSEEDDDGGEDPGTET